MSSLFVKEAQAFYRQFRTQIIGVVVLIALAAVLLVAVSIPSKLPDASLAIDPRIRAFYTPAPDASSPPLHMPRTFTTAAAGEGGDAASAAAANYTSQRNAHWLKLDSLRARVHSKNLIRAFGSFSALPPFLGRVLEVGCGPMSLAAHLMVLQPREMISLTIVDPQLKGYLGRDWSNLKDKYLRRLYFRSQYPFTAGEHDEDFEAFKAAAKGGTQFDTIIWHGVLPHMSDSFVALESLFSLLAPFGNLILVEQTYGSSEDVHQQQKNEQLQAFLANFQTRYRNDESVLQRLAIDALEFDYQQKKQNAKDKSHTGLVFFIGTKAGTLNPSAQVSLELRLPSPRQLTLHFYYHPNKQQWRNMIRKGNLWKFMASIDSIFAHHPTATVHIFSNQLLQLTTAETDKAKNPIQPFLEKGYKLRVQPWNLTEFFDETPLAKWAQMPPPFDPPRLNDAFRLAVLYKYGGVALEPDMMLLHPLDGLQNNNFVVKEAYRGAISRDIIAAQQHHPFLNYALVQLADFVNTVLLAQSFRKPKKMVPSFSHLVDEYTKLDPTLVPFVSSPAASASSVNTNTNKYGTLTLYGPRQFFPFPWQSGGHPKFSHADAFRKHEFDETMQHSYTFRIWRNMVRPSATANKSDKNKTADEPLLVEQNYLHPHSFLGRLIQANCVALCERFLLDNQNVQMVVADAKRVETSTTPTTPDASTKLQADSTEVPEADKTKSVSPALTPSPAPASGPVNQS